MNRGECCPQVNSTGSLAGRDDDIVFPYLVILCNPGPLRIAPVTLWCCLGRPMSTMGELPAVKRFVRKLRGGCQSILAESSDGVLYVVKFRNNLQGPNVLFNESIGTELYRLSKLPVPIWRPVVVKSSLIEQNPGYWFETAHGTLRPDPGLCFGSQFLGSEGTPVYEILPGNFYKLIRKRSNFWLAWLLDVCASHSDNRQAVFSQRIDGTLDAHFIDHGHIFGGPKGEERPRPIAARYLDPRLYDTISYTLVGRLAKFAAGLDIDRLWAQANALPDEWRTRSACARLSDCLNVVSSLRMVEEILNTLIGLHCHWKESHKDDLQIGQRLPSSVLRVGVQVAGVRRRIIV